MPRGVPRGGDGSDTRKHLSVEIKELHFVLICMVAPEKSDLAHSNTLGLVHCVHG
jgi:hypothetical protein